MASTRYLLGNICACLLVLAFLFMFGDAAEFNEEEVIPTEAEDKMAQRASTGCGPVGFCPRGSKCIPLVLCAPFFISVRYKSPCMISRGSTGVCCPTAPEGSGGTAAITRPPAQGVPKPEITKNQINQAIAAVTGKENTGTRSMALRLPDSFCRRTPVDRHHQFKKASDSAMKVGKEAKTIVDVSTYLTEKHDLSPLEAAVGLQHFSVFDTTLADTCPRKPKCRPSKYRTMDGSCNNVVNTNWGQRNTPLLRILPAEYTDGIHEPIIGVNKQPLPSPRLVSTSTIKKHGPTELGLTLLLMQMGQFIDHNFVGTPITSDDEGNAIDCCTTHGEMLDEKDLHEACMPIAIPRNDTFYSMYRQRCMNFVRSLTVQNSNCTFGAAEQLNQVTHYLDGSAIYGSSVEDCAELRTHTGGQLKMQGGQLLPADGKDACDATRDGQPCFMAGDIRVNEQPYLAAVQTIWMREHNRIAMELSSVNPEWDDEILFQESRRIVAAQLQHIVYNEWLPIILGTDFTLNTGLLPKRVGYYTEYDTTVNVGITNEFSTAAFRFGHSLVQGYLALFDANGNKTEHIVLWKHFFDPDHLYKKGKLDEFLRSLCLMSVSKCDLAVSTQITEQLMRSTGRFGLDLVSLNIQRGRDHAIPRYNSLREVCGLPRAERFTDLNDTIPSAIVDNLALVYDSVDDIDPFIGGIAETPEREAVVGPTFRCILADQFHRLKKGDRFYYENGGMSTSFTQDQLDSIRSVSLARVMCDNSDGIDKIQPLVLRKPWGGNNMMPCSSGSLPSLNLKLWATGE